MCIYFVRNKLISFVTANLQRDFLNLYVENRIPTKGRDSDLYLSKRADTFPPSAGNNYHGQKCVLKTVIYKVFYNCLTEWHPNCSQMKRNEEKLSAWWTNATNGPPTIKQDLSMPPGHNGVSGPPAQDWYKAIFQIPEVGKNIARNVSQKFWIIPSVDWVHPKSSQAWLLSCQQFVWSSGVVKFSQNTALTPVYT